MVNIEKSQSGSTITVKINGVIQEGVEFDKLIGTPSGGELVINTKDVKRINSTGVKHWIQYFQKIAANGVKLRFSECSPPIVDQINLIKNFTCGGSIESISAPFSCTGCNSQFISVLAIADLRKLQGKMPEPPCPKCKAKTVFDDSPEEYLAFLKRS